MCLSFNNTYSTVHVSERGDADRRPANDDRPDTELECEGANASQDTPLWVPQVGFRFVLVRTVVP